MSTENAKRITRFSLASDFEPSLEGLESHRYMRRLGECFVMDSEPDSGHPTPRDFENIGDVSESPDVSISPLTSTPIAHRQRETSFHHYVQCGFCTDFGKDFLNVIFRSETYPERVENSSSEIFVESAKQLILTTEKNRQLTKENERILNQTIIWNEEKCNLEKKLRDANMLSDSLRLEVETKNDKIYWLEKRLLSLSNVASDQATDEDCKVSVELRSEKKDVSIQCTPQDGNMNYARRKVSHEEPECWQEDCAFMEMENCEMRNDKKQFFREGGVKTPYYAENGEECKRLNEKINALQLECTNLSEVLVKNDELVKSLSNANMIIAMKEATECDLKLKLEKSEKQIHDLKNTIENMERIVDDKVAETKKLNEDCDKLQKMIGRLTDENVSITVSNEELKKRLSRANNEIEELQSSVANERKTCQAAQEASSNQNDLRVKLTY
ncbi:hypothetical protein DICVIV_04782 [Dictyocaulus viviparus]|uniref:Uncharacterized protein n=1 Tax=Dictyocaulus viviparus TaxID=29172 RepID=A0A0D8XX37_DICVI|nr:hypothetical protein DICVIV_04782 [Dictyocaulus viviparus]